MARTHRVIALIVPIAVAASDGVAQTPGAYLGDLSWPEAEQRLRTTPVVVIPFGAGAKEHGPHLPMNADAVVMEYLSRQAVMEYLSRQAVDSIDVIVAPPILHGWFPAFRAYPGTEVESDVFTDYVFQVANSLVRNGAQRIVFLNTGISRATGLPISVAARELRVQTGTPTLVVSWDDLETQEADALAEETVGGHAGEMETSIHLLLQPDLVDMEQALRDYRSPGGDHPGYAPGLFSRDPADPAYSDTGLFGDPTLALFGDPTLATTEKGAALLRIMTHEWLDALRGFSEAPVPSR
jgi:creatinine amidohydrolase